MFRGISKFSLSNSPKLPLYVVCLFGSIFNYKLAAAVPTAIDVLFTYSQEAKAYYGDDDATRTRINHLVAKNNLNYRASGVRLKIRIAHTQLMDIVGDDQVSDQALDNLSISQQVIDLRNQYNADFVSHLTVKKPIGSSGSSICGIGWINGTDGNTGVSQSDAGAALSVVGIDCPTDTLGHELGHNMGLVHSRKQELEEIKRFGRAPRSSYFYAKGYGIADDFVSIMAYQSAFSKSGWPKAIPRYSNPNRFRTGRSQVAKQFGKYGVKRSGANAVRALNSDAQTFASFSDCVWTLPRGWNYPVCQ